MTPFQLASTMLGKREVPDRGAITDYLRTGGANLDPATAAWCAAFVNSSLQKAGLPGTGSNMARSFLSYGQAVNQPQKGDIAVFSRGNPNSPLGHVGFFDGYDETGKIRVLGGNQGNAVSYASYDPKMLLGFRRAGDGTAIPQGSLADAFKPDNMPAPTPTLGGMLAQGVMGFGQQRQADEEKALEEKRRKQALFGDGGLADMFA